jgi:hypothetical protein
MILRANTSTSPASGVKQPASDIDQLIQDSQP